MSGNADLATLLAMLADYGRPGLHPGAAMRPDDPTGPGLRSGGRLGGAGRLGATGGAAGGGTRFPALPWPVPAAWGRAP